MSRISMGSSPLVVEGAHRVRPPSIGQRAWAGAEGRRWRSPTGATGPKMCIRDRADTIEELAEALSLPVEQTVATVNRYNELCDGGRDLDFFKMCIRDSR